MKIKIPSVFKNVYFIIIVSFIIWMLFFDSNSYLVHRELNKNILKLEKQKDFYKEGIKEDTKELNKIKLTVVLKNMQEKNFL